MPEELPPPDQRRFDGATYDPEQDQERLSTLLDRVYDAMKDGQWHTIPELGVTCAPGSEAGISARLRDLRKGRFGGHTIERQRVEGGLFRYRLVEVAQ